MRFPPLGTYMLSRFSGNASCSSFDRHPSDSSGMYTKSKVHETDTRLRHKSGPKFIVELFKRKMWLKKFLWDTSHILCDMVFWLVPFFLVSTVFCA